MMVVVVGGCRAARLTLGETISLPDARTTTTVTMVRKVGRRDAGPSNLRRAKYGQSIIRTERLSRPLNIITIRYAGLVRDGESRGCELR